MHRTCIVSQDFSDAAAAMLPTRVANDDAALRVGRYRLGRSIKRGGMAEVFEAYLDGQGGFIRRFALKRPLPDMELCHLPAFADEARILSQLDHPGIVSVFDFGAHEGWPYQVLELVDGLDLASLYERARRRGTAIPVEYALQIVEDAAEALDYAHRAKDLRGRALGIVHRDVSPHNIVISWRGEVKVLDFGVALANGRLTATQAGVVKGKLSFMAPEQLGGRRVTPLADVFSLGCVLHALLFGESPFVELDRRVASANGEPLPLADELEPDLRAIIEKATAHDPSTRFKDAAAVAAACSHARRARSSAGRHQLVQWLATIDRDVDRITEKTPTAPNVVDLNPPTCPGRLSGRSGDVVVVGMDHQEDGRTELDEDFVIEEAGPTSRLPTPVPSCGPYRLVRPSRFHDQFYSARGPDGTMVGLRLLDVDATGARMFADAAARCGQVFQHALSVTSTGSSDRRLYFTTPHFDGILIQDLAQSTEESGGLSPAEVAALGVALIDVATEDLGAGPSRRPDVRPQTTVLSPDGSVVSIDVIVDGRQPVTPNTERQVRSAIVSTLATVSVHEPHLERILSTLISDVPLDRIRERLTRYAQHRLRMPVGEILRELHRRLDGPELDVTDLAPDQIPSAVVTCAPPIRVGPNPRIVAGLLTVIGFLSGFALWLALT